MVDVVLESPWVRVELLEDRGVVLITRTERRATGDELVQQFQEVISQTRLDNKRQWGLVLDMRDAPGNNSPEFEEALAPLRKWVERNFSRRVTVVSTAVGDLQVRRLARNEEGDVHVAHDLDAAIRIASGQES